MEEKCKKSESLGKEQKRGEKRETGERIGRKREEK